MRSNLSEWIEKYDPNKVLVSHLPGGETVYADMVKTISAKFPKLPVHDIEVKREDNGWMSTVFNTEFRHTGVSKQDLFTSDLTLVVNEKGKIIPVRLTNRSETIREFIL